MKGLRRVHIMSIFLLLVSVVFAQDSSREYKKLIEAGDKFFTADNYYSASQEYLKASKFKENDGYPDIKVAECYRINMDYNDAEKWYEKCVLYYKAKDPTLVYWLANVQKSNGKYSDAQINYSKFIKGFKPQNQEDKTLLKMAEVELKGCIYAQQQLEQPSQEVNISLLPFPVNTKNSEFSPVLFYHDSSIVITSARADSKGGELNLSTGEGRTDNFRYEKRGDRWLRTDNEDNFDAINTLNDDGAGQLSIKYNKYYYTMCDPECGIYVSKKVNGKFTKGIKLNVNINDGYWNAQPTITENADTLFFVSKRDGGQGQNDIWMSVNGDRTGEFENWGVARNLYSINSPGAEIAPFWDAATHSLYFASNGRAGFGGLDIYKTKIYRVDSTVNLGLPFNSNMDDFYFALGKLKGYLVSNRLGGFGFGDIYSFDRYAKASIVGYMPTSENPTDAEGISSLGRLYYSDTQASVSNTSVFLKDDKGMVLKEAITNQNGEFRFENLAPDKNFKIIINSNDPRIRAKVDYFVNKQGKMDGKITYSQTNSLPSGSNTKSEAQTSSLQPVPSEVAKDSATSTKSVISQNELVKGESVPKEVTAEVPKQEIAVLPKETVSQKKSAKVAKNPTVISYENVYYDFNSTDIPANGKIVLDQLALFMADNPNSQVEIKAFTDGLGNTQYNLDLAKKRGQACFDYLLARGVDQTALLINPAGSVQPVGKNSSFTGRQLNRRVQFLVTGVSKPYQQQTMVYILEPRMTLYSLSKKYKISVEELMRLNGLVDNNLKAYAPIRLPKMGPSTIAPATLEAIRNGSEEYRFENMRFVPVK